MQTDITKLLGIEHPIISAPMGPDISGPDLVAAVSNAGGFGILQAQLASSSGLRDEIRSLLAGQAVGQINDIKPAKEIVLDLVQGIPVIRATLTRMTGMGQVSYGLRPPPNAKNNKSISKTSNERQ